MPLAGTAPLTPHQLDDRAWEARVACVSANVAGALARTPICASPKDIGACVLAGAKAALRESAYPRPRQNSQLPDAAGSPISITGVDDFEVNSRERKHGGTNFA
jgi:hypothetical protein